MSSLDEDAVRHRLLAVVRGVAPAFNLNESDETVLADNGLDSLAKVSLLVAIEDEFGVVFPNEVLVPATFRSFESVHHSLLSLLAVDGSP